MPYQSLSAQSHATRRAGTSSCHEREDEWEDATFDEPYTPVPFPGSLACDGGNKAGSERSPEQVAHLLAQQYPPEEMVQEAWGISQWFTASLAAVNCVQSLSPGSTRAFGDEYDHPSGESTFHHFAPTNSDKDSGKSPSQEQGNSWLNLPVFIGLAAGAAMSSDSSPRSILLGGVAAMMYARPAEGLPAVSDSVNDDESLQQHPELIPETVARQVIFQIEGRSHLTIDPLNYPYIVGPSAFPFGLDTTRKAEGAIFYVGLQRTATDPEWNIGANSVLLPDYHKSIYPLRISVQPTKGSDGVTHMLEIDNAAPGWNARVVYRILGR